MSRVWLSLLVVVALSTLGVVGAGARAAQRGGEWAAVAIIIDLCVAGFGVVVLLVGALLRRKYAPRSSALSWSILAIWAVIGVLPTALFTAAHAWKVFGR